ncbi:hypothetical protein SESBI_31527 [Sesbania bispinosa]|nr:hypothetical protein SESBI_31527 [Sesbania bispinosa]
MFLHVIARIYEKKYWRKRDIEARNQKQKRLASVVGPRDQHTCLPNDKPTKVGPNITRLGKSKMACRFIKKPVTRCGVEWGQPTTQSQDPFPIT